MSNFRGQDGSATWGAVSIDEMRSWSLDGVSLEMIDDTVKGDTHRTFLGGLATWEGTATAWLDYDDAEQAELIDAIATDPPDGAIAGLMFQVASGKTWYGAAEIQNFRIDSPEGSAVTPVTFDFQGTGQVLPDWTA